MIPLLAAIGEAAWWAGLGIALKNIAKWCVKQAPGWLANIAAAIGIYFVVAEPITELGLQYIMGKFNGVPGTVAETLYYLDVDNYVSAIISAYSVRAAGKIAALGKKAAVTS